MNLERLMKRGREIVGRVIEVTPLGAFLGECAYARRLRNQDPSVRRLDRVMIRTAVSLGLVGVGLDYFCGVGAGTLPLNGAILLSGVTFLDQIGLSS